MKLSKSVLIGIVAMGLPVLAQASSSEYWLEKYRWRNDNGSETGATWKAAENTAITGVKRGDSIRLRFALNHSAYTFVALTGRVEYAESSTNGPWNVVDASGADTAAFEMMPTPWYADGEAATEQITATGNGGGGADYLGGTCCELPSNPGVTMVPYQGGINVEYCFRAGPTAKRNTKYYFRLTGGGATVDCMAYAQLTIQDTATATAPSIVVSNQTLAGGVQWYYPLYVEGTRPMTYGAQGLPAGITRTGTILSGRPTAYGTFPVSVTASNALGTDTKVLTLVVSEPATEVIVDDQDKAGVSKSSADYWIPSTTSNLAWNGMCLYNLARKAEVNSADRDWVRWTPDLPMTAQYDVYARWTYAMYRGRNVPYKIGYAGGTNEVFMNQRDSSLSAKWNLLGRYTFNLGTSGWVELGGNDGEACADAVRFVRVD